VVSWANQTFLSEGLADSRWQRELQVLGEGPAHAAEAGLPFPDWTTPGETEMMAHDRRTSRLGKPAGGGSNRVRRLPGSLTAPASERTLPRVRVLIADDHRLFVEALSAFLGMESWIEVVGRAGNGQEAVDMAAALSPDLILIDLEMPVMDGLEAIRRIRERSEVPMLLLTGSDSPQQVARARAAGASGFLRKDMVPANLITELGVISGQTAGPLAS
jgi:CheY-like chemotaxis protein